MSTDDLPPHFAQRLDESDDALFYATPRLVTHIDDATIRALTEVYRARIPAGSDVLDLMSSWISHLPNDVDYGRVAGHGMNATELENNPRLTDHRVHDLNADPNLPFADDSFDFVVSAVSVQYLTRPVAVLRSVARKLRPAGEHLVAISHRMFPTKAVQVWQGLAPTDRPRLVETYFERSGAFSEIRTEDHSPAGADPLWVVSGRRIAETPSSDSE